MSQEGNQAKAVIETWDILVRHRWRFVLSGFLVAGVVLGAGLLLPRKYKAQAIFERRTDIVLSEIVQRGAAQSFENTSSSVIEEIVGLPAIDELIESLQKSELAAAVSMRNPSDLHARRSEFRKKVLVNYDITTKQRDRVRVTFIDESPRMARAVVNTLIENYISRTREQIDQQLGQAATFFQTEVDQNRGLIETLENEKLTFEIEHAELLPNSPGSIQDVLTDAHMQLITMEQGRDAARMRVESLQKLVDETPQTVPRISKAPNPELARLRAVRQELRDQFEEYTGVFKMTGQHPDLLALREQLVQIDREIAATDTEVITHTQIDRNPKREALDLQLSQAAIDLRAYEKQAKSVQKQIEQLNARSANLFPIRSDYQKLGRRIEQAHRQLAFWEDNLRRVQMARAAEAGQRGITLSFIKPCETIQKPTSPDLTQVFMAAVLMGIVAGGVSVFVAYRADDTFDDGERMASQLKLSFFGSVSEVISRRQMRVRKLRRLVLSPIKIASMAVLLTGMAALLYLDLERPDLFRELTDNPSEFVTDRFATTTKLSVDGLE